MCSLYMCSTPQADEPPALAGGMADVEQTDRDQASD
jgi:hypothetical protein